MSPMGLDFETNYVLRSAPAPAGPITNPLSPLHSLPGREMERFNMGERGSIEEAAEQPTKRQLSERENMRNRDGDSDGSSTEEQGECRVNIGEEKRYNRPKADIEKRKRKGPPKASNNRKHQKTAWMEKRDTLYTINSGVEVELGDDGNGSSGVGEVEGRKAQEELFAIASDEEHEKKLSRHT